MTKRTKYTQGVGYHYGDPLDFYRHRKTVILEAITYGLRFTVGCFCRDLFVNGLTTSVDCDIPGTITFRASTRTARGMETLDSATVTIDASSPAHVVWEQLEAAISGIQNASESCKNDWPFARKPSKRANLNQLKQRSKL